LAILDPDPTENWLHHYGGENHPNAQKIKSELLKVFYLDTEDWKLQVWQQGKTFLIRRFFRLIPHNIAAVDSRNTLSIKVEVTYMQFRVPRFLECNEKRGCIE